MNSNCLTQSTPSASKKTTRISESKFQRICALFQPHNPGNQKLIWSGQRFSFSLISKWIIFVGISLTFSLETFAQTGAPCNAVRWDKGGHWTGTGCGVNDANNAPAPLGIVRCANAADTESGIDDNTVYTPANFTITLNNCKDPNTTLPVTINPPFSGQKISWFNFDVRPFAGIYDFQTIATGSYNLSWALYYSTAPTCNTGGNGLSGNCAQIGPLLACGTNFTGWSPQPFVTPVFNQATNLYLVVWRTGATNSSNDDFDFTFKARYGCGDLCSLFLDGAPTITCNANGTYTVVQKLNGTNTTISVSAPGSNSIVTSPSPLTFTTADATPNVNQGTVTVIYNQGTPYNITFTPSTGGGASAYCNALNVSGSSPCCAVPTADAGPAAANVCSGSTYTLAATATNGTILWTTSGTGTFNNNTLEDPIYTPSPADIAAGTVTLTMKVTGSAWCPMATDTIVLTFIPPPTCTISGANAVCSGSTGNVFTATAGMTTYNWTITGSGTIVGASNAQNVTVTAGASGSFTLTSTITAPNGCISTCMKTVIINPNPTCSITGANAVCTNSTVNVFTAPGGMSTYLWTISGNGSIVGANNTANVTVTAGSPGSFTLTLVITDANNCSSTCMKTVTVNPNPTCSITGADAVCINTTGNVYSGPSGMSSWAWSISGNGTIVGATNLQNVTVTAGSAGNFTLTLVIVDGNGCTSTCMKTVVVNNSATCNITGANAVCAGSLNNVYSGDAGMSAYAWSISGNGTIIGSATSQNVTVTAGAAGSFTLTLMTTAPTGCVSTCMKTVTVNANPSCSISGADAVCAASMNNVYNAPGGMTTYAWSISGNGATVGATNTSSVTVTAGAAGSFTLTLVITDANGCSSTCMKTVTVKANPVCNITGPTSVCPGSTNQHCSQNVADSYSWAVSAGGSISGSSTGQCVNIVASGTCGTNYTVTLTMTTNGCTSVCTQLVNVVDNTPPAITCPINVTIACTASTAPSNTGSATATDNCSSVTITHTDVSTQNADNTPGTCDDYTYVITRTWKATDACGNMNTCNQTINVQDILAPAITCPINVTIACTASTAPSNTGSATATDNCSGVTITHTDVSTQNADNTPGTCDDYTYTITRTWKATDACGNMNTCNQTINVQDILAPAITCPINVTIACTASTDPSNTGSATATDNCSGVTITHTDVSTQNADGIPGTCDDYTYVITRTWKATDACGNMNTCNQTINVQDITAPAITCPINVTIECTESTLPANTGMPSAIDNCTPIPSFSYQDEIIPSTVCIQELTINRTWRATDACGNFSTCLQVITVVDNTPPVLTCPTNLTLECNSSTDPTNTGYATATDNCDPSLAFGYSDQIIPGTQCPQNYTIIRLFSATDDCGNTGTCTQIIVVQDTAPPDITCPANVTIECTESSAPATTGEATATDICDPFPTITYLDITLSTGGCTSEFIINRTWKATDDCGNFSTCVQVITIDDSTAPDITCPVNVTIECTESTLPAHTGMASATDNCDLVPSITYVDMTVASTTCVQEYTINRTWKATDDCGNFSTCVQVITIDDSTAPDITCPVNVTIECTESTLPAHTGTASATDNCDLVPSITYEDMTVASTTCVQEYTINRTWKATDDCGNFSTCVQVITIDDSTAPDITCPVNVTIECTESTLPAHTGMASATDNCDLVPAITFEDMTVASTTCVQEYTINRTWKATDDCGNMSTCLQVITVDDSTAPDITCPVNVTIECTESTLPANTGMASATDNCDAIPSITYTDMTVASPTCVQEYTINRTWKATDDCGNFSTCLQVITVDDSTAPDVTCPVNVTIECTESTLPANTGMASATDNCDAIPSIKIGIAHVSTPVTVPSRMPSSA